MACLRSYQNLPMERKPAVSPVGKLMLSVVQVGVWTYWCVKMTDFLVIARIHLLIADRSGMLHFLVWTPPC